MVEANNPGRMPTEQKVTASGAGMKELLLSLVARSTGYHSALACKTISACTCIASFFALTPSTPAVPNVCCSKSSVPYWSNPTFFLIFDIRARMSKIKNVGLDHYGTLYKALRGSAVKGLSHDSNSLLGYVTIHTAAPTSCSVCSVPISTTEGRFGLSKMMSWPSSSTSIVVLRSYTLPICSVNCL